MLNNVRNNLNHNKNVQILILFMFSKNMHGDILNGVKMRLLLIILLNKRYAIKHFQKQLNNKESY